MLKPEPKMEAGIIPVKRHSLSKPATKSPKRVTETSPVEIKNSLPELIKEARKSLHELKEFLSSTPASALTIDSKVKPESEPSPQPHQKSGTTSAKKSKRKSGAAHPFHPKDCLFVFPAPEPTHEENDEKKSHKKEDLGKDLIKDLPKIEKEAPVAPESSCNKKLDFTDTDSNKAEQT